MGNKDSRRWLFSCHGDRMEWRSTLKQGSRVLWDGLIDTWFPAFCRVCGQQIETPAHSDCADPDSINTYGLRHRVVGRLSVPLLLLCDVCAARVIRKKVPAVSRGTETLIAVFEPTPEFFALLHVHKYESALELVSWFGHWATSAMRAAVTPGRPAVLVPIPLHAKRQAQRGFNQAGKLAHEVARNLDLPVASELLRRRLNTPALSQLALSDRAGAIQGAFELQYLPAWRDLDVFLIDDVVTSGATFSEARKLFRDLPGVRFRVLCLTVSSDFVSSLSGQSQL